LIKFEFKVEFSTLNIPRDYYDDPVVEVAEGYILAEGPKGHRWIVCRDYLDEDTGTSTMDVKARELNKIGFTEPKGEWAEVEPAYGTEAWEAFDRNCAIPCPEPEADDYPF